MNNFSKAERLELWAITEERLQQDVYYFHRKQKLLEKYGEAEQARKAFEKCNKSLITLLKLEEEVYEQTQA